MIFTKEFVVFGISANVSLFKIDKCDKTMKFEVRPYSIDFQSFTILLFFFVVNMLALATFVSSIRLHLEISYQRSKIDQPTKKGANCFWSKVKLFPSELAFQLFRKEKENIDIYKSQNTTYTSTLHQLTKGYEFSIFERWIIVLDESR